jgi:hypothetical protein
LTFQYFKKNRRLLPEATIWKYFVQIMRGLAFMHSKSIMHRGKVAHFNSPTTPCLDIKPANIFITAQGVAKLGDLGLGRFFSNQTHQAHSIVGTPYYMWVYLIWICRYLRRFFAGYNIEIWFKNEIVWFVKSRSKSEAMKSAFLLQFKVQKFRILFNYLSTYRFRTSWSSNYVNSE